MFNSRPQQGFSLIEVMVAVLVISIGLLGVAVMQLIGLKGSSQSHSKSNAAHHAHALLERMRGNITGVHADNYVYDSSTRKCTAPPAPNCGLAAANCTPKQLADYDLFSIYCGNTNFSPGGVRGDLSGGRLIVSCPVDCQTGVQLELSWNEQALGEESGGKDLVNRQLSLNTVIK